MELLESVRVSLTMILAIAAERPSGVSRAEGVDDEVDGEVVLEDDGERGTQVVRGVRIVMVMVIRVRGRCILLMGLLCDFCVVYSFFVWGIDVCVLW